MALALGALLAACGSATATSDAQEILARPNHANLRDAHFVLTGTFVNQGKTVTVSGSGDLVYKSGAAGRFTFQSTAAGRPISLEDIFINGTDYTLTLPGTGKWTAHPSTSGLGPTSFSGASSFLYLGEATLPQGKAWHARAKDKDGNAFEGWIRETDGYPLKYTLVATNGQASSTLMLSFDGYNTGVTITSPPASEVSLTG